MNEGTGTLNGHQRAKRVGYCHEHSSDPTEER